MGLDNTKLGLKKGSVKLRDVQLKPDALSFLELPVDITHGSTAAVLLIILLMLLRTGKLATRLALDDVILDPNRRHHSGAGTVCRLEEVWK